MQELEHSAKGSTWKNHKYTGIQVVNGKKRYIYGSPSTNFRDRGAGIAANRNAAINRRIGGGGPSTRKVVNNVGNVSERVKRPGLVLASNKYASAKSIADKYKADRAKKIVQDTMSKVSNKSVSSATEKAMKAMKTAVKRTRTSSDAKIQTESGATITIPGLYENSMKKKRWTRGTR